jgi:ribonuclease D
MSSKIDTMTQQCRYPKDTMTSNNNLPAEIISEIASYDPRFKAKLEKLFMDNQEIIKHNKNVYGKLEYIDQRGNDLASMIVPGYIDKEEYKEVMEDLDNYEEKMLKERKCINCKRR